MPAVAGWFGTGTRSFRFEKVTSFLRVKGGGRKGVGYIHTISKGMQRKPQLYLDLNNMQHAAGYHLVTGTNGQ